LNRAVGAGNPEPAWTAEGTMHIVSSAVTHVSRNDLAARLDGTAESVARPLVRDLLERAPAFGALSGDTRRALASNTVSVAAHLAEAAESTSQTNALIHEVDFPAFVAGLINGVFGAIVDASIKQMQAYGELVQAVSDSIDDFSKNNLTEDQARDYLAQNYPDLVPPEQDRAGTPEPPCYQRLIAEMMALGIAKIMSAG